MHHCHSNWIPCSAIIWQIFILIFILYFAFHLLIKQFLNTVMAKSTKKIIAVKHKQMCPCWGRRSLPSLPIHRYSKITSRLNWIVSVRNPIWRPSIRPSVNTLRHPRSRIKIVYWDAWKVIMNLRHFCLEVIAEATRAVASTLPAMPRPI